MKIQLSFQCRKLVQNSLHQPGHQWQDMTPAVQCTFSKVAGCYVMHESLQDPEVRREMERFSVKVCHQVCRTTEQLWKTILNLWLFFWFSSLILRYFLLLYWLYISPLAGSSCWTWVCCSARCGFHKSPNWPWGPRQRRCFTGEAPKGFGDVGDWTGNAELSGFTILKYTWFIHVFMMYLGL